MNCYVEPVYTMDADTSVSCRHLWMKLPEQLARSGFHGRGFCAFHQCTESGEPSFEFSSLVISRYQKFPSRSAEKMVLGQRVQVMLQLKMSFRGSFGHGWTRNEHDGLTKRKKDELETCCDWRKHFRPAENESVRPGAFSPLLPRLAWSTANSRGGRGLLRRGASVRILPSGGTFLARNSGA